MSSGAIPTYQQTGTDRSISKIYIQGNNLKVEDTVGNLLSLDVTALKQGTSIESINVVNHDLVIRENNGNEHITPLPASQGGSVTGFSVEGNVLKLLQTDEKDLSVNLKRDAHFNSVSVDGQGQFSGVVQAQKFTSQSDVRLKTKISKLQDPLSMIQGINSYIYEIFGKREIGFIAQELTDIQGIVHKNDDGFLSVDYSRISVILLACIKKQQEKIDKIEKLITSKEQKNIY